MPHLTHTAVDGLVFEELDVLFRSEDFFHTLEILATSLFLYLSARLALVYTERVDSGALLRSEVNAGEGVHSYLASGTLVADGAVAASTLALLLALLLGGGGESSDAHCCEENEMFHNGHFFSIFIISDPQTVPKFNSTQRFKHP